MPNIDRLFWPLWLMVSQLRNGQVIENGDALYQRACLWIEEGRTRLTEAGVSKGSVERMIYTLCVLLDESVLSRKHFDSGTERWRRAPLQVRFFSTLYAGEALWERIKKELHTPQPDVAFLTCFARALALGFVGNYRERGDERREDVIKALSEHVSPFAMATSLPEMRKPQRVRTGRILWWGGWLLGGVVITGSWLFFTSMLQQLVSQFTGLK